MKFRNSEIKFKKRLDVSEKQEYNVNSSRETGNERRKNLKVYEKLRDYIDSHGIKREYISEKSGIPSNVLSYILNGKRKLNVEEFILILGVLNIDANTIINK